VTSVSYFASKSYSGNRPWADVELGPSSGRSVTLKCLVDTGADYLQINAADASIAGISLANSTPQPISTAAGTTTLQLVTGVTISIEGGAHINVDVLVDTSNSTKPPLLGRTALLKPFDVGFDPTQWMST
jgi:predicted aspartyl protease